MEEKGETERAPRRRFNLVGAKEKRGGLKTAVLGKAQFFVLSEVDFGRGSSGQGSDDGGGWPGPGPGS